MEYLRDVYNLLPPCRAPDTAPWFLAEPLAFSAKAAVSFLCAAAAAAASFNVQPATQYQDGHPSEVPYYGRSPAVYPSPIANGSTSSRWAVAYGHARAIVSQMTVDEKVNITHGWPGACVGNTGQVPRLGVPALCFADGPSGIRGQEFVSAFPAGIHVAATFDRHLMHRYGRALGDEYRGKGINVALGPVAGPLGRMARGGRNWEGLSNDPYLAGAGLGAITRGIQDAGVIATPKHWLLNEQEFRRRWSSMGDAISANVDDRALHELYVFPFMEALREGAAAIMCSYQRANHSYACQNSKLLNGILKTELGFEGFVVSDWDGQMSGVASVNAGLDLVMPNAGFWGASLAQAVRNGSVSQDRISDMATRVLAAWYFLHQQTDFPPPAIYPSTHKHAPVDVQAGHTLLIKEIGAAGTVLVKNVNNTLPLIKPRFLCVYGYDAPLKAGPWQNPDRYGGGYDVNFGWGTLNGTLVTGGGSGGSSPPYVVSPFQALQERVVSDRGVLRWDFYSVDPHAEYLNADACLVFINAYASEMFDRTSLADAFSDRLVANVAAKCQNTIVVVHSAGIRTVDAWIGHPNVTAVVFGGLPGQESGHSLTSVLYGDVSPSGRLPYTVARNEADYGDLLNSTVSADYFPEDAFAEGLFIDYRAFDRDRVAPRFEFGFGLSYTTFGYAGLSAALADSLPPVEFPDAGVPVVQGGHPDLWATVAVVACAVTNTGAERAGSEVAQLYVGVPGSDHEGEEGDTPARQLRGFVRVGPLAPGETRQAVFGLTRRDLSVWDVVAQQWRLRRGEYRLWVGASSRDLRLNGTLSILD
ncbi:glycosyl hydrolase family 3 N terminal domain-containing protein [Lasiosphaeria miniovina]|uniref:Beta-glucosidase cel3A n=1 Tax=Lasiosphaeria miniovina TaxID=1954250 RepID=A0AA40A4S4_9PEZI|nr:glycosyl hydrolase family 3 N terminal domain-containing protein [Lasiosphaeria miniovina]KAK0709255.1 glycosyl hydrolase family 3 N terminal domain-containing protein [Lasiosphaeria miniovina]